MKKVLLTLTACALIFSACQEKNEEGEGDTDKAAPKEDTSATADVEVEEEIIVQHYGAEITEEGALTAEEFKKEIQGKDSVHVKVTSKVNAVCQKKGCWMNLDMGEDEDMRVRFKDYEFFVPKDSDGKIAFVEGWAFVDTVSVEMQKHYLEDAQAAGEEVTQEEINAITEPKVTLAFMAEGVILKDHETK